MAGAATHQLVFVQAQDILVGEFMKVKAMPLSLTLNGYSRRITFHDKIVLIKYYRHNAPG